jgi:DNA invertase Pin-like site-specific DNA recombinase
VVIREHNNPSVGGDAPAIRRVATYTYSARADPHAIAAQQGAIDTYIAGHEDWGTVAAYTDSAPDRPGLNGALDAARRGEFDMLVVHRLDRLSRRTANLATILIALDSATVGLVDVAESYDRANPVGWTNLLAAMTPCTNEPDGRRRLTAIAERSRCRPRHLI